MAYSADKKPGELTALTTLATDDVFVVGDTSDASEVAKGITKANLITDLTTSFATAGHNHTGVYAPALGADDNYVTDAEKIVIGNTSGTNTGDNAVNSNYSGLVTNATHTGEVTGSGALTLDKTAISNKADTVITASDVILFGDATDTGNLKSDTVQGILDLVPGGGNVSKVGTPVDNQIGVWTGDGTIEGDAGLTYDTTTNVLSVNASTANYPLVVEGTSDLSTGPFIKTKHTTASPAALDYIGGVDLYSSDSAANEQAYAYFNAKIISPTSGAEYGSFVIETVRNGAIGGAGEQMLEVGAESDSAINGISVGFNSAAGVVSSRGDQDLILKTGNATTGNITIVDGANGNVQVNPNGTGALAVSTTIELGHATDTTISRVSAGVVAVEGVTVPTISSTNTLTNKRVTKRIGSTTSSATPTINTDDVDIYKLTAQTVDITSFTTNLSGTPTDGQTLIIQITGTAARAITWGASFEASTVALPTTTVSTNRLDVGFIWNTVTSKWRCIASA